MISMNYFDRFYYRIKWIEWKTLISLNGVLKKRILFQMCWKGEKWIKSLQGPHPVPCSRTLQNLLDEGLLRALKGHCGGGHVEGSDGENFSFLHGGSSAGAALELPHCHLAPGAATKSWAHTIPNMSWDNWDPSHSIVKSKRCIYLLWSLADPVPSSRNIPEQVLACLSLITSTH